MHCVLPLIVCWTMTGPPPHGGDAAATGGGGDGGHIAVKICAVFVPVVSHGSIKKT